MRQLLDTHTFLWYITDNPNLSRTALERIQNEENDNLLSMTSVWEMAVKQSVGKLSFKLPLDLFIPQQLQSNEMKLLDIQLNHVVAIATLPLHHRDPFDRLLIAQAMVEQLPILGIDTVFDAYPIERIW